MLSIEVSCEIGDLIAEVAKKSGRFFSEVETAFFQCGKYPESRKTYLTDQFGGYGTGIDWLDVSLEKVLTECGAKSICVTQAI